MAELDRIKELKESSDINEINKLLKVGWVILTIKELEDRNIYTLGLNEWKEFYSKFPTQDFDLLGKDTNE